jgi:hypothetical protein
MALSFFHTPPGCTWKTRFGAFIFGGVSGEKPLPSPRRLCDATHPFAQKEIFADKSSLSRRQRPTTSTADHLAIGGFGVSFHFDNAIKRIAMRALKIGWHAAKRRSPLSERGESDTVVLLRSAPTV